MVLIERDGLEALTTNAIAAAAGVSIGTLYQFFPNREAILDTLAAQENAGISERIVHALHDSGLTTTEGRMTAIAGAVAASYGARRGAHRILMARALARGGRGLAPLLSQAIGHLTHERRQGQLRMAMAEADAFVVAHALLGVLRAMTSEAETAPPQEEIARALTRLVVGFIQPSTAGTTT